MVTDKACIASSKGTRFSCLMVLATGSTNWMSGFSFLMSSWASLSFITGIFSGIRGVVVSKKENVESMLASLKKLGATEIKNIPMHQGNKVTRIIAWTFLSKEEKSN